MHFRRVLRETVRQEVTAYLADKGSLLCQKVTMDAVGGFSWPKVTAQIEDKMPVFNDVLKAAVTAPKCQGTAEWRVFN